MCEFCGVGGVCVVCGRGSREFLVRDDSGRGGAVKLPASDVCERFADDWEDAKDGEESFAEVLDALDVGQWFRIDGATVVSRVA